MLKPAEVTLLLSELCKKLGFCLLLSEIERLSATPPSGVDAFADAVFLAEGMNPEMADRHLYRQVRAVVRDAFASSESSA